MSYDKNNISNALPFFQGHAAFALYREHKPYNIALLAQPENRATYYINI